MSALTLYQFILADAQLISIQKIYNQKRIGYMCNKIVYLLKGLVVITLLLGALAPAATLAAPPGQESACAEEYTVQADDWLSKIADKFLGNGLAYPAIFEATNQQHAIDPAFAQFTNPDLIEVGWQLCIPSTEQAQALLAAPADVSTSQSDLIVITDALGREVTLASPPQRIVITGRALFMIADAAYLFPGAAEKIVGMGDAGQGSFNFISLIDPNYAAKATLSRDAGAEQVAALKPDLVILKSFLAETVGAPVEAVGIPVVYVDLETPEQYARDLAILGKVFQDESRAQEVAAFYQSRVAQIEQTVNAAANKPRVLMLYYNDRDGNVAFNVPPRNWIQTQMVEIAGGEPVWADANPGSGWTQVTLEQIAAWDADQIFIIAYLNNPSVVVDGLKTDPNWQPLRAVKEGQLYAFPADLYSWDQPDTRWILGLTWLAGRIHPDQFSDLDITAEAQAFYESLYGLDAAFFVQSIQPTFQGDLP
jgi:iron complex transport system substrate-binding protein